MLKVNQWVLRISVIINNTKHIVRQEKILIIILVTSINIRARKTTRRCSVPSLDVP